MKIAQLSHSPIYSASARPAPQHQEAAPQDAFERSDESKFGSRVLGGIAGGIVGALAGQAGPQAVTASAGLGTAAVTVGAAGPFLKESLEAGKTGDLFNDLTATCATIAAGGFLTASAAAGAAGLVYPLASAIPGAAPILGGIIGASVGAFFGIPN